MRRRLDVPVVMAAWIAMLLIAVVVAVAHVNPDRLIEARIAAAAREAMKSFDYAHALMLAAVMAVLAHLSREGMRARLVATFMGTTALLLPISLVEFGLLAGATYSVCAEHGTGGRDCDVALWAAGMGGAVGLVYWLVVTCLPVATIVTFAHAWLMLAKDTVAGWVRPEA